MASLEQKTQIYQEETKREANDHVEVYSDKDVPAVIDAESLGVNEKALLRKTYVQSCRLAIAEIAVAELTSRDLRLVPWLALLYLLSFLDRTNIGK